MYTELKAYELKALEAYIKKDTDKFHSLVNFIDELLEQRYQVGKREIKKRALECFEDLIDGKYLEKGTILQ